LSKIKELEKSLDFDKPTILKYNDLFYFKTVGEDVIVLKLLQDKKVEFYCVFVQSQWSEYHSTVFRIISNQYYDLGVSLVENHQELLSKFQDAMMEYLL
jgi:hypothetical protein